MKEKRTIIINDKEHDVNIHIEPRGSIRASITNRGINIRVPRYISQKRQEAEIQKLIDWAKTRIIEKPRLPIVQKEYKHNDQIKTHSKTYQLSIEIRDSIKNFSKIDGDLIIFKISKKHDDKAKQKYISKQLQKLLAEEHIIELRDHVLRLNRQHIRQSIKKISYNYTHSRWGACNSTKKELYFCTKLLLAPLPILEYVIIHELAHLIEPNHSDRFWQIIEDIDPFYKLKKKWLKEHGHELII
jgi:hypothetical protein